MTILFCLLSLCALWVLHLFCAKSFFLAARVAALSFVALFIANSASAPQESPRYYLGFDRNDYPGDEAMKLLRHDFAFTGYWLSRPPDEKTNTWSGKRELVRSLGYGFVVLYGGPDSRELKTGAPAKALGTRNGKEAVVAAKTEGFSSGTIIFLDIEEGGRLPETYHAYLTAWSDEITLAGYRGGVYCSGIAVKEEPGVSITTSDDIHDHARSHDLVFWVFNDFCPPSAGCTFPQHPPSPARSGLPYASVWQFAQSPRRRERTLRCAVTYHRDGNCYAPVDTAHRFHLDVNSATWPDPSGGAK